MCTREVQQKLAPTQCLVGLQSVIKDPMALIMEFTDAGAAGRVRGLCGDLVLLSPRQALIRTEVAAGTWHTRLSDLMRDTPQSCILKIKYRPNQNGGRPWAQPAATARQVQAVRAQAAVHRQGRAPGSEATDMDTELSLNGTLGPDPGNLLRTMMAAVSRQLNGQLQEQADDQELRPGGWVMLKKPGTDELSGRIKVRLGSISDVRMVEETLHNYPIAVGAECVSIQVHNPFLQKLPQCSSGNGLEAPSVTRGGTTP